MRVSDVLRGKPRADVVTIPPEASVSELIALLAEHNVGALVVSRDGTSVDGIVSERDVVRRLQSGAGLLDEPVSEIMSAKVRTCGPTATLENLMQIMTDLRVRHVPVVQEERLTGIVSIGDVVKHRMAELQFERDQLDSYVHQT